MKLQPLLSERSAPIATLLTVVVPVVYGIICGFMLGNSKGVYTVLSLLAIPGGFLGGMEHDDTLEGAWRGLLGGLLFGTAIIVTLDSIGDPPLAKLPDPHSLLIIITAVAGVALGVAGAAVRRRRELRAARA